MQILPLSKVYLKFSFDFFVLSCIVKAGRFKRRPAFRGIAVVLKKSLASALPARGPPALQSFLHDPISIFAARRGSLVFLRRNIARKDTVEQKAITERGQSEPDQQHKRRYNEKKAYMEEYQDNGD